MIEVKLPEDALNYLSKNGEFYLIKDGVSCSHKGCRHHISHPCENCGRIAAKGNIIQRGIFPLF